MNEKKLEKLLIRLLQAQDDIGYSAKAADIDRAKVNELFNRREDIRDTILAEFVALRRQRDGLAELVIDAIAGMTGMTIQEVREGIEERTIRAALASIEKEGSDD